MTPLVRSLALSSLLLAAVATQAKPPEFLNSPESQKADLPFSEAVRLGDTVYLSGQIGRLPGTMTLVPGGIRAESKQTLENIRATLLANGLSLESVVKCTVMLADIGEWSAFNEVWRTFFHKPFPARSALGANGLALGARVEVDCIAAAADHPSP